MKAIISRRKTAGAKLNIGKGASAELFLQNLSVPPTI